MCQLILILALLMSGCIGLIGGQQLSSDQIAAMQSYNDRADVYGCALLGGPPPSGNIVAIFVPKGAPVEVSFGPDCHGSVKAGGGPVASPPPQMGVYRGQ